MYTTSGTASPEIPLGDHINFKVFSFRPGLTGRFMLDVRMNTISERTKLENGDIVPTFGTTWWAYLSINNVLQPQFLNFATIANHPVVYNGSVFPSTQVYYLLADLTENDEVSLICMHMLDAFILINTPPFFAIVTKQSLLTDLQFYCMATPALYPDGLLTVSEEKSLTIPLDTSLDTALEFPLGAATLNFNDHFTFANNKLVYTGNQSNWFKITADLNISGLELKTSDGDPVVIDLQSLGFAVGVNGTKYNAIRTESNVYADTRYVLRLVCNQTTSNIVQLNDNESVSLLMYFYNCKYLNVPPVRGAPSLTPAAGSTITIKGTVNISVESTGDHPPEEKKEEASAQASRMSAQAATAQAATTRAATTRAATAQAVTAQAATRGTDAAQ
jgi:hypothetical protein